LLIFEVELVQTVPHCGTHTKSAVGKYRGRQRRKPRLCRANRLVIFNGVLSERIRFRRTQQPK
jgi:hypothetical protein